MEVKKLNISHQDARGIIKDLFARIVIDAAVFITSKKGAVRGNHYHKKTHQYDYVLKGSLLVMSQKGARGRKIKTILKAGDLMHHPPGERHAYRAREYSEFLSFTRGPRRGTEYESDTYRLATALLT